MLLKCESSFSRGGNIYCGHDGKGFQQNALCCGQKLRTGPLHKGSFVQNGDVMWQIEPVLIRE